MIGQVFPKLSQDNLIKNLWNKWKVGHWSKMLQIIIKSRLVQEWNSARLLRDCCSHWFFLEVGPTCSSCLENLLLSNCNCGLEDQTAEHILQIRSLLQTVRTNVWPTAVQLYTHQTLWQQRGTGEDSVAAIEKKKNRNDKAWGHHTQQK